MKLATTTGDFDRYCSSYLERIRNVYEAGFKCIDLSLYTVKSNDELILSENWKDTVIKIKDYAEDKGIEFVQAHAPDTNALGDGDAFNIAVERTIRAIEICGMLRIPNIVVHPGWDKNATKEEWFEKNYLFIKELFPAMEAYGVNVLHENTTGANMPWYFPKTGAEMKEFSEFVNHPLFHSCWDTGHANIEGSQYDEIMAVGKDLYGVHINDNRGFQDEHIIPFCGTLNMDEIMHALKDAGYNGAFTFEASSTLRADSFWLGNRHEFKKDSRLANPPIELQQELEKFLYNVGVYILKAYDEFEE
jgi:sugar phosphate isomerase/epimerase